MDTFEHRGLTFRIETEQDTDVGPPWKECDGHGNVRDCQDLYDRLNKSPGERVLYRERHHVWVYDWQGAIEKAKQEGWGLNPDAHAALTAKLGREPTAREICAEAVQRNFDYCRRYLTGDWSYVVLTVTLLDVDGNPTDERECLGGVESDDDAHIQEMARELADEIAGRVGRRKYIETRVRVRK